MNWVAASSLLLLVVGADETKPQAPATLEHVIARVKEQEALFRNLDAVIKTSRKFHPQPERERQDSLGPPVWDSIEATIHQVTRGAELSCSREEIVSLASGKKLRGSSLAVSDGKQTIAIDEGNSATVFPRRYEPAWMFPPHCWPLFTLEVNFPLSLYLQGTDAMKRDPKVRRLAVEYGSVIEFNKVEAELVGEENIDDLACVKVKVLRWYYTRSPPAIQHLWLAKDRNYHVAQVRTASMRKGKEVLRNSIRVTRWRELAEGIWLPAAVESLSFDRDEQGNEAKDPRWTRRLALGPATLNPEIPSGLFALPAISDSLPKFVLDKAGRLADDPQHPQPADAEPSTTLNSILERLAVEEKKYDRIEVGSLDRYQMLDRTETQHGGLLSSETRGRSISAGGRLFYQEERQGVSGSGETGSYSVRQAFDGERMRALSRYVSGEGAEPQSHATLALSGPDEVWLFRAHTRVFERNQRPLATFLKSGWLDERRQSNMTVEYVGDSLVAGLHCHKLKGIVRGGPTPYFLLWLARDRNLIAVRHEWHEPTGRNSLPAVLHYVDELREIRPGVWFPFHVMLLAFQRLRGEGMTEGRPLIQWRHDVSVESLTLDPTVEESLFTRIDVPEGTKVQVRDEHGEFIGQFEQPQDGNIDASEETLETLRREKAKKDQDRKKNR